MSLETSEDLPDMPFLDDIADQLRDQHLTATISGAQLPGVGGGMTLVTNATAFARSTTEFLKGVLISSRVLKDDLVGAVLRTSEVVTAAIRAQTLSEVAKQFQRMTGDEDEQRDEHSEEVRAVLNAIRFTAAAAGGSAVGDLAHCKRS